MMNDFNSPGEWSQATAVLRDARNVAVLSGAGISAESGIPTFRDGGGFWMEFPPDQFANWKGLLETAFLQPRRFADFLLAVLTPIATAQPNSAHEALAKLESSHQVTIITQNIDGLHQDAGSSNVIEIHGSLFEIVKMTSSRPVARLQRTDLLGIVEELKVARDATWPAWRVMQAVQPLFGIGNDGTRRPNLVLFGDAMAEPAWSRAQQAARDCDLIISVGTSRSVEPAASLLRSAEESGKPVIVVDPLSGGGDIWLRGTAGDLLPRLIDHVQL